MKPKKIITGKAYYQAPDGTKIDIGNVKITCKPDATLKAQTMEEILSENVVDAVWISEVSASAVSPEHPSDTFDHMTALGYKLNLITGEYEKH